MVGNSQLFMEQIDVHFHIYIYKINDKDGISALSIVLVLIAVYYDGEEDDMSNQPPSETRMGKLM